MGNNHGTLRNGATFAPGLVGQTFSFDGVNDWVEVPSSPTLNFGTRDFTVELWVNFQHTDDEQLLIEKWIQTFSDEPSLGWFLTKLPDNVIRVPVELDVTPPALEAGVWYFVTLTREGTTFTVYWNGLPLGSTSAEVNLDTNASLKLGHRCHPEDTPGCEDDRGFYLAGLIDEVSIYNRALSATEIQDIFNAGSEGKCKDSEITEVKIDIKPGSSPNSINPKNRGVVPVAILTTDTFDATTVDPLSVRFGPNGAKEAHNKGHIKDVNHDGEPDIVLHFKTLATGIQCGQTSASLTGETFDGDPIQGADAIKTVRCKN